MNWLKAAQLGAYLMAWFARASRDGKITGDEVIEAVAGAASLLGLGFTVELPGTVAPREVPPES